MKLVSETQNAFGALSRDNNLLVDLRCFESKLEDPEDGRLVLLDDDGRVHTFTKTFCRSTDSFPGFRKGFPQKAYHASFQAEQAIVGPGEWLETYTVSRLRFRVPLAEECLLRPFVTDRFRELTGSIDDETFCFARVDIGNANLEFRFSANWTGSQLHTDSIKVYFAIIPTTPTSMSKALRKAWMVARFFSISNCQFCTLDDVALLTPDLRGDFGGEEESDAAFHVYQDWLKRDNESPTWWQKSVFNAKNEESLAHLRRALERWSALPKDWHDSTTPLLETLLKKGSFNGDSVLAAYRFLDNNPCMKPSNDLNEEQVSKLVAAADEAAREEGLDGYESRISGALGNLKKESFKARCTRISRQYLEPALGKETADDAVTLIERLRKRRGIAAHSSNPFTGREEISDAMAECAAANAATYIILLSHLMDDTPKLSEISLTPILGEFLQLSERFKERQQS